MNYENIVVPAMKLWLFFVEEYSRGKALTNNDIRAIDLCYRIIRDWSVAPLTTPIMDIIRMQGIE